MSVLEAILLGLIQGLTEFLPISSTGHLTVAGKLFNLIDPENPEQWTAFIAVIQLGTLIAVLFYFRNDLWNILISFSRDNIIKPKKFFRQEYNSKLGWYIILGSIPVVIVGLGFKEIIEGSLTKNLYVISASLITLGIILAAAEKLGNFKKDMKDINWVSSIVVGIGQCLALIPGSSRSGTTITAGIFLGFKRETAARFSFLLSVPAVLGSGLLEFYQSLEYLDEQGLVTLAVATFVSALSGYLTIAFLLNFLKSHSTYVFVFYRIVIGVIILILLNLNLITA
ncbi:MAG: undecaprenyl-diphosphatase UppP [Melioribacteraceae bacterium]|nr:undecaprenyl-diphosphatase UppP [Melioribacteraceae bacterium]